MKKKAITLVLLAALLIAVTPFQSISGKSSSSSVDAKILNVRTYPGVFCTGRTITVKVTIENTGRTDYDFWVGLSFKDGGGRTYDIKPEKIRLSCHFWGKRSGTVTFKWKIPRGAYANSYRPLRISVAVWKGYNGKYMQGLITRYRDRIWVEAQWIHIRNCT